MKFLPKDEKKQLKSLTQKIGHLTNNYSKSRNMIEPPISKRHPENLTRNSKIWWFVHGFVLFQAGLFQLHPLKFSLVYAPYKSEMFAIPASPTSPLVTNLLRPNRKTENKKHLPKAPLEKRGMAVTL